jgi:hypothetical protein
MTDDFVGLYTLDDHGDPVPCYDTLAWGRWMEEARANGLLRVAQDRDEGQDGRSIWISTVFLGLDHNFAGGVPLLFETMVFEGQGASERRTLDFFGRYPTRVLALLGHQEICAAVTAMLKADEAQKPHQ